MSSLTIDPLGARIVEPLEVRVIPTAERRFYRPELDVLRLGAFLTVFLSHGLPGFVLEHHSGITRRLALYETHAKHAGAFGVCLFFMLSAYLITELLLRESTRTGRISIPSFYARRILRIWPLYFTFLFLAVLLGFIYQPYRLETRGFVAFLFLAGNWYAVTAAHLGSPIRPLWSVSVEEQFYLLWPVIARFGRRRSIAAVSLLLLPLASLRVYLLTRGGPDSASTIWFDSLAQFQFFALGALLALALRGRVFTLRPATRILAFSAGLSSWLLANFVFHVDRVETMPSPASMLSGYGFVALGCLLLFAAFLGASLDWFPRPLVYLGKISYGLYVFHMLSLNIAGALLWPSAAERAAVQTTWGIFPLIARALLVTVVALAGTVLLAALSYQFLERPFLKLKQRFTLVPSRNV